MTPETEDWVLYVVEANENNSLELFPADESASLDYHKVGHFDKPISMSTDDLKTILDSCLEKLEGIPGNALARSYNPGASFLQCWIHDGISINEAKKVYEYLTTHLTNLNSKKA